MSYQHSYAHSISDPAAFWAEQAAHLAWHRKPALTLQKMPTVPTAGLPMAA